MIKGKGRYQDNQRLEMQSHILLLQYQNTNWYLGIRSVKLSKCLNWSHCRGVKTNWYHCIRSANKLISQYQICCSRVGLNLCCKVIINRDSDGPPEVVEEEDVLNVQLAEEPAVVLRPELHVWVSGEERLPGQLSLLRVRLNLDDGPGEDEVSAPRVLLVVVVLLAVVALGWQGEE